MYGTPHPFRDDIIELPGSVTTVIPVPTAARSSISGVIDTFRHCERVSALSKVVLQYLCNIQEDLGDERIYTANITDLTYSITFHDIGKLLTPKSILTSTSRLSNMEFEIIKHHTSDLASYIRRAVGAEYSTDPQRYKEFIATTIEIATLHHERLDGSGYPFGVGAAQIKGIVRVCSICDSIDAMASRRVYSDEMHWNGIIQELFKGSGEQFDPRLVKAVLDTLPELQYAHSHMKYQFELANSKSEPSTEKNACTDTNRCRLGFTPPIGDRYLMNLEEA